jgi:hypothetical protein
VTEEGYIRLWNSLQTVAHRAQNNEVTFYEWLEYFEQLLKEPEKKI